MQVNYVGASKEYIYRVAEIDYDDETEQTLIDRLIEVMEEKGWEVVNGVSGVALCEVDDMMQYKDFVRDYKEVKKSIRKSLDYK